MWVRRVSLGQTVWKTVASRLGGAIHILVKQHLTNSTLGDPNCWHCLLIARAGASSRVACPGSLTDRIPSVEGQLS